MIRSSTDPAGRTFEDFYREVQPRLLASLLAFTEDADLATEAVDEAFVRALLHWDRVLRMAAPSGWLYRVAVNTVRRQARRQARERATVAWLAAGERRGPGADADLGLDLREAIAGLPERQRLAVVLRYVADLPERDIAQAMGIRRSTVSATLAKARIHLQRQLADHPMPARLSIAPHRRHRRRLGAPERSTCER